MRSVVSGSIGTAWSKLKPETSIFAPLFCNMRMRSPSIPRMVGLPTLGPKELLAIPGKLSKVSPSVDPRRWVSAAPESCWAGTNKTEFSRGRAVMVMSSRRVVRGSCTFCAETVMCEEKNKHVAYADMRRNFWNFIKLSCSQRNDSAQG